MSLANDRCDHCGTYLDPMGGNDCRAIGPLLLCEDCLSTSEDLPGLIGHLLEVKGKIH